MVKNNSYNNFGNHLHELRIQNGYSLKKVADYLNIDISLWSKIEHGERQIQSYMLKGLCELFQLEYKKVQIEFLNYKIENEYGDEPFLKDAVTELAKRLQ
jgi:transcriptional regulator with XRE-family HTH domain